MKYIRQYGFIFLSFVIIFTCIYLGFQSVKENTQSNQREGLEKALRRGILECYALEGHYPESLEELVKNYHIVYNKDEFDIKYEVMASNIMPTITIIEKD